MASNHPKGSASRSGSQLNPFQQDSSNAMNSTAHNNFYQQLCALAGVLSHGNIPPIGTTTSRPQENVLLNPAILNQLLSMNPNLDASAVRSVHSPAASEVTDGNNLSSLFLNPQLLLQMMEQQRQNSISSVLSNPAASAVPFSLLPLLLEKQGSAFAAPSLGVDESLPPRNEESVDPNLLKLQTLLAAKPAAASVSQSHLNSNTSATPFPNQVALMQLLTNAIQQQAQINRGATTIPTSVSFQRPPSPNFAVSSQIQGAMASSSTTKMGSTIASDTVLKQQGSWLSSASGDVISSQDLVDGSVATMPNAPPPPGNLNSFPSVKSRSQTHAQGHVVDASAMAAGPMNSLPSKAAIVAPSQTLLSQMQTWSVAQLEKHVNALMESNQPIPQAVHHLLTEARRKEDKRNAKRVANRKSACTSRARKKALVEEMTRANERLKRQVLILSLLPDLVISITVDGEITFCSDQVERVLHHQVNDLCGANIDDIILPASRDALHRLIQNLAAAAEQAEAFSGGGCSDHEASGGGGFEAAAIISEGSSGSLVTFPLSVVNVKNYNRQLQLENQNRVSDSSDMSHHKVSTVTRSISVSMSGTQSSFGNHSQGYSSLHDAPTSTAGDRKSSDDDSDLKPSARGNSYDKESSAPALSEKSGVNATDRCDATSNRGDDSCSSLSADNGKEQQKSEQKNCDSSAENASPKNFESSSASSELSDEKRNKNGSEDSGYRESAESENSESDGSNSNELALKSRPLAPTCNICLIRADLSTIWCEVTSSIHTTSSLDDRSITPSAYGSSCKSFKEKKESDCSKDQDAEAQGSSRKELLLCLRPIRDGTEKVSEELRFRPPIKPKQDNLDMNDIDMGSDSGYPNDFADSTKASPAGKATWSNGGSSSKRRYSGFETGSSRKRAAMNCVSNDTEKTVAESLMLMSYFQ